jgi:hypothetical protein
MATTTNYGWAEPDNTSLVKNGAQDMRILGDAIDASVWNIGFGQAGKNKIINGDFGIWQRGTSFNTTGFFFGPDRFKTFSYSGSSATISRQAFTVGSAPVAGYEAQYFCRISSTNTGNILIQNIEDVRTFAGQTITVSFWAKSASATTVTVAAEQNFGSGGSASVYPTLGTASVTTSWARYSVTYTIPSISGKTIGTSSFLQINLGSSLLNNNLDIWGVQAEYGSKATPFQTASGESPQAELAMCQRYYQALSTTPTGVMVYGGSSSGGFSANAYNNYVFPVVMRISPTVTFYAHDGTAGAVTLYVATTAIKSTSVASIGLSPWGWSGNFNSASWGTNADSGLLAYGYKAEAEL